MVAQEKSYYVICIRNERNAASLELRKLYRVITNQEAERTAMLRVADESGEDYLFPASWFIPGRAPFTTVSDPRAAMSVIRAPRLERRTP